MKDLDIDAAIQKVKNNKFLQEELNVERGAKAGLTKIMSEMDEDIKAELRIRDVIGIYRIRMEMEGKFCNANKGRTGKFFSPFRIESRYFEFLKSRG